MLETKPQRAIKIIGANELEINIEFARALDYRDEPENYDPLALPGQKYKPKREVRYLFRYLLILRVPILPKSRTRILRKVLTTKTLVEKKRERLLMKKTHYVPHKAKSVEHGRIF